MESILPFLLPCFHFDGSDFRMAGKVRREFEISIVQACAAAHGVSERSVRTWRNSDDARWLDFKTAWVKRNMAEGNARDVVEMASRMAGVAPAEQFQEPDVDDGLGDGLHAEITRAERECKRLAHRAAWLERRNEWDAAAMCHRVLDAKRDQLRKLRLDTPEAGQRDGSLIPRETVVAWAAAVVAEFRALPGRIMSKLPMDAATEIRDSIEKEIASTLQRAAEMELVA
jgi:hypothetical protein